MPTISSPGIGSGLDVNAIVQSLINAQGQPQSALLDRKEGAFQVELSALGTLKSSLSEFRQTLDGLKDLADFQARKTKSTDVKKFTASATEKAVAGSYDVEVLALASSHKVASPGFANSSTAVGTGTLTIQSGSNTLQLSINDSNKTLAGIRDAINGAADNPGVNATIVQVDDGLGGTESRLVLSAENSGTKNAISVSVSADADGNDADASGLSALATANLTDLRVAANAQVKIDGLSVTADGNQISDAIDGVTLDLVSAEVGTIETLTITLDKNKVKSAIGDLVKNYNAVVGTLDELTARDAASGSTGALFGDSMVRHVSSQLYRNISGTVPTGDSPFTNLSSIGVSFDRDGLLQLDSTKLDAALESNFDDVGKLFAGEAGIAARVDSYLDKYLDSGGVLDGRTKGVTERIEDIGESRQRLQERLGRAEARYRAQFQALDLISSQFQNTSNYLSQQLSNLPGFTNNNS